MLLQAHFTSLRHNLEASANVPHFGVHASPILSQPQSDGDGTLAFATRDWPHTWPAWNNARLTCCSNAELVGGMFSSWRLPNANNRFRASFTFCNVDVRLYKSTTNLSSDFASSSLIWLGDWESLLKRDLNISDALHTPHAFFCQSHRMLTLCHNPIWHVEIVSPGTTRHPIVLQLREPICSGTFSHGQTLSTVHNPECYLLLL